MEELEPARTRDETSSDWGEATSVPRPCCRTTFVPFSINKLTGRGCRARSTTAAPLPEESRALCSPEAEASCPTPPGAAAEGGFPSAKPHPTPGAHLFYSQDIKLYVFCFFFIKSIYKPGRNLSEETGILSALGKTR